MAEKRIPTLDGRGWIKISDISGVVDELIAGYFTSLHSQSYIANLTDNTRFPKVYSFVKDINVDKNNINLMCNNITNSIESLLSLCYDEVNVTSSTEDTDNHNATIHIRITIIHDNVEYVLGSNPRIKKGKVDEYMGFTLTANPFTVYR